MSIDNTNFSFPVKYPACLTLTCSNLNNNALNYLDLKLLLHNNNIFIDLYDKHKDFSFQVNIFTCFNSCFRLSAYRNILLNH